MSDSNQEKMAQAFAEQQAQWGAFTAKALESSMKLFELNLRIARRSIEEVSHSAQQLMVAKSPEQLFSVDPELIQEKLNQIISYANEVGEITSSLTAGLSDAAQAHIHQSYEKATKLADDVAPQADFQKFFPQLSDANLGYEQWLEAGKKLAESFSQAVPAAAFKPPVATKRASPAKAATKPVAKPAPRTRTRAK